MPPSAHSKFGASSAYRWVTCPGSVALCEAAPCTDGGSSSYANEGTAAHELAERSLLGRKMPSEFVGEVIRVEEDEFIVDEEMASHVRVYVNEILKTASPAFNPGVDGIIKVESRFTLDWIGRPGMWGTCDASLADRGNRVLHVFDLKYGAGVPVYAKDNWQLMYYALGILGLEGQKDFDTVRLVIVQPRCEESGVTEHSLSVSSLLNWKDSVLIPAYDEAHRSDARLTPSEKACRWCAAKPVCPALCGLALRPLGVEVTEESGKAPTVSSPPKAFELPVPELLSDEAIRRILDFLPLVKPYFDSVYAYATERAMKGDIIEGYKLVEGRKGNRIWADEKLVEETFSEVFSGLGEELYEKKLLSPAKVEKVLGKEHKRAIDALTTRSDGKLMLVPESDKRPAVPVEPRLALDEIDFGQ